ncbi:hypothetical protein BJ138DRAFT_595052 [Hygrophoropsis aurantiaca]|uniref:Uncharacterized protein n=1 Tax=Hygrophoropsis aurantiaca TaxID=72124 RepID=A0ACB8ASR7_9AGAM|nr:hypothetical protein BJ138DRAFT_595052 [Hygrophoropsis aurantiaca]
MSVKRSTKGKKRTREETPIERSSSSLSPAPSDPPRVKKPKRAETRPCPACDEMIPIRLLAAHNELELQRVEEIIRQVGSIEVLADADDLEEGPSSKIRRSALKARKSLSALNPQADGTNTLEVTGKAIQIITRRRKQRHAKLKEMAKEEEATFLEDGSNQALCPVCSQTVRGDRDVIEAHVDACLAHESRRIREQQEQEDDFVDIGEAAIRVTDGVNLNGTGIHVRNENDQDVDDEVDVDGDDEAMFGDAQFTEGDILGSTADQQEEIDIENDPIASGSGTHQSLRDLVAEGKVTKRDSSEGSGVDGAKAKMVEVMGLGDSDKMDLAIVSARKQSDPAVLVRALESKIKQLESMRVSSSTSLLCRICLDPYTEPTASTGCWHTCCRECWLRCLGSTKLCPICKRITAAADLRRVYL